LQPKYRVTTGHQWLYGTLNIGSEYGVDLGLSKSFASKNQKHLNLILKLNNNQSQVQTYFIPNNLFDYSRPSNHVIYPLKIVARQIL
jgi:hypothetical protein